MWNTLKWTLAALVVVLSMALTAVIGFTIGDSGSSGTVTTPRSGETQDGLRILEEIYRILGEDFVNPGAVQTDRLDEGAIRGAIAELGDPHTQYISPENYEPGFGFVSGAFEGIGAQVDTDPVTGEIVIVAPFRESPAEAAGIRPGDVILAVDGEDTSGWTVNDAVQRIRGPEGTPVTLTVRHLDGEVVDVTITRGTIVVPTVYIRDITDEAGNPVTDLAFMELQQFTDRTASDMRTELQRIKDEGYNGLILDLRRNPGGGLDATVKVTDLFLDDGVILTQVSRDGGESVHRASSGGEGVGLEIVVLVGPGSASGAEVLAGALRDHGVATLVGEQTFGKGSVNHIRELSNGGALYVTIARWLTPNGEQIEGVGLTPDIAVEPSDEEIFTGIGPQLYTAIDHLRGALQASR